MMSYSQSALAMYKIINPTFPMETTGFERPTGLDPFF